MSKMMTKNHYLNLSAVVVSKQSMQWKLELRAELAALSFGMPVFIETAAEKSIFLRVECMDTSLKWTNDVWHFKENTTEFKLLSKTLKIEKLLIITIGLRIAMLKDFCCNQNSMVLA